MQVPVLKGLQQLLDQLVLSSGQGASNTRNTCLIIEQVETQPALQVVQPICTSPCTEMSCQIDLLPDAVAIGLAMQCRCPPCGKLF